MTAYGDYFTLKGGFANEALIDLTGCPSRSFIIEDEEAQDLWERIKESDEEGYLMNASTMGEDRWVIFNKNFN